MRRTPLPLALLASLMVTGPAAGAASKAFVACTDFTTGALSVVDLATRVVTVDAEPLGPDAVVRWWEGALFAVNRFGQDNVQVIGTGPGYPTLRQTSTGNGSNPQDICFVSPTKAYVSRYESSSLLVMDPSTGATLGSIALGGFADADGIPEMARMVRVEGRVFVALQRLDRNDGFKPNVPSLVVAIDAAADTVLDTDAVAPGRQAIMLAARNPVTTFEWDRRSGRLLIGCAGRYGIADGGIEALDPLALASLGLVSTEAQLGGDIGDVAIDGQAAAYAIVSDAGYNTSLVRWSPQDGSRLGTLYAPGGFSLSDAAVSGDQLWVCRNDLLAPGLYLFRAGADTLVAGPLDTGLPPYQLAFDEVSGVVLGAPPGPVAPAGGGAHLSAAQPHPARDETRFELALARPGAVRVEAFDAAGRRVAVLAAGDRPAGRSTVTWRFATDDGRTAPPGLYFVRARGDGFDERRRVVRLP